MEGNTPTVKEFIDAVEKNGYEQGYGGLFIFDAPGKVRACAAGQALVNLGLVDLNDITSQEAAFEFHEEWSRYLNNDNNLCIIYYDTWHMNDRQHLTPQQIAAELRSTYLNNDA